MSIVGCPRLAIRVMMSWLYSKHASHVSYCELVIRWTENVQWQYFGGIAHFQTNFLCDPVRSTRLWQVFGESGSEELLKITADSAVNTKAVHLRDIE